MRFLHRDRTVEYFDPTAFGSSSGSFEPIAQEPVIDAAVHDLSFHNFTYFLDGSLMETFIHLNRQMAFIDINSFDTHASTDATT